MATNNKKILGMKKNTILYLLLCFILYKLFDIGNKKDICELVKEYVDLYFKNKEENETTRQFK